MDSIRLNTGMVERWLKHWPARQNRDISAPKRVAENAPRRVHAHLVDALVHSQPLVLLRRLLNSRRFRRQGAEALARHGGWNP